jgi:hypothetical protein
LNPEAGFTAGFFVDRITSCEVIANWPVHEVTDANARTLLPNVMPAYLERRKAQRLRRLSHYEALSEEACISQRNYGWARPAMLLKKPQTT